MWCCDQISIQAHIRIHQFGLLKLGYHSQIVIQISECCHVDSLVYNMEEAYQNNAI
jgi:hypothetical protein